MITRLVKVIDVWPNTAVYAITDTPDENGATAFYLPDSDNLIRDAGITLEIEDITGAEVEALGGKPGGRSYEQPNITNADELRDLATEEQKTEDTPLNQPEDIQGKAVESVLTENYTYQELFAPGEWHSDEEAASRSALVGTPKPLNLDETLTSRGEIANPTAWEDDPDSVAAVQEQEIYQVGADIVEDFLTLQEDALADIGVFDWDAETSQAQENATALISGFFEKEFVALEEDIKEQRLRSTEDFTADLRSVIENAQEELTKLDITQAETEQDLLARLDAIGGRESYEKAEQGRIMANAAEELQIDLGDIQGRAEFLTAEQRASIEETQEEYTTKLEDIAGAEAYGTEEKRRLIDEARNELEINLADITGQAEFITEEESRKMREAEEEFILKMEDLSGRETFEIGEQQRTISSARDALSITLRDITGEKEYTTDIQERVIRETEAKLQRELGDIGAREAYDYSTAQVAWGDRIAKEEEAQLGRGRGFSGVMREEMGKLDLSKATDLGEIVRSYAVQADEALATAEFTIEDAGARIDEALRTSGISTERAELGARVTQEEAGAQMGEIERRAGAERATAELGLGYEQERGAAGIAEAGREAGISTQRVMSAEEATRLGAQSAIDEISRRAGVTRTEAEQIYSSTVGDAERAIGEVERGTGVMETEALMRERTLREQAQAQTGEIGRLATSQQEEAEREAMFTQERTQAAREEVEAQKSRGVTTAETAQRQSIRAYGAGVPYGEIPENVRPVDEVPERGIYGERSYQELGRERSETELAQVNQLLEQRQQEHEMFRREALETIPEYSVYESSELRKRTRNL